MSKYLLQEDECAPDSEEYFELELKEKFGLTIKDFKTKGKPAVSDDGMCLSWDCNGYRLEFCGDAPYYTLERITE